MSLHVNNFDVIAKDIKIDGEPNTLQQSAYEYMMRCIKAGTLLEAPEGTFEEGGDNENIIIQEVTAVFGVIQNTKAISTWSFMYNNISTDPDVMFFQKTLIPILQLFYGHKCVTIVDESQNIIVYNSTVDFSIYATGMIMKSVGSGYNLRPGLFGEYEQDPRYNTQMAKSVILGYSMDSTVKHNIEIVLAREHFESKGEDLSTNQLEMISAKFMETSSGQTMKRSFESQYAYSQSVVLNDFSNWLMNI